MKFDNDEIELLAINRTEKYVKKIFEGSPKYFNNSDFIDSITPKLVAFHSNIHVYFRIELYLNHIFKNKFIISFFKLAILIFLFRTYRIKVLETRKELDHQKIFTNKLALNYKRYDALFFASMANYFDSLYFHRNNFGNSLFVLPKKASRWGKSYYMKNIDIIYLEDYITDHSSNDTGNTLGPNFINKSANEVKEFLENNLLPEFDLYSKGFSKILDIYMPKNIIISRKRRIAENAIIIQAKKRNIKTKMIIHGNISSKPKLKYNDGYFDVSEIYIWGDYQKKTLNDKSVYQKVGSIVPSELPYLIPISQKKLIKNHITILPSQINIKSLIFYLRLTKRYREITFNLKLHKNKKRKPYDIFKKIFHINNLVIYEDNQINIVHLFEISFLIISGITTANLIALKSDTLNLIFYSSKESSELLEDYKLLGFKVHYRIKSFLKEVICSIDNQSCYSENIENQIELKNKIFY